MGTALRVPSRRTMMGEDSQPPETWSLLGCTSGCHSLKSMNSFFCRAFSGLRFSSSRRASWPAFVGLCLAFRLGLLGLLVLVLRRGRRAVVLLWLRSSTPFLPMLPVCARTSARPALLPQRGRETRAMGGFPFRVTFCVTMAPLPFSHNISRECLHSLLPSNRTANARKEDPELGKEGRAPPGSLFAAAVKTAEKFDNTSWWIAWAGNTQDVDGNGN